MVSQRTVSPATTISPTTASERQKSSLTAVVKGAGPSGLASAIALSQNGYTVRVAEKRAERPLGQGRQNMVAVRPEAFRRLEQLGALSYLLKSRDESGNNTKVTRMTHAQTASEVDGTVFVWPLKYYPPAEPAKLRKGDNGTYEAPATLSEQFPSSFITLGSLEDSLRQAATRLGIEIVYDATLALIPNKSTDEYSVSLTQSSGRYSDLGTPNLIVLASGKNDAAIPKELSFARRTGVLLEPSSLPDLASSTNARALRLSETADHELESQLFCVFGIKNPSETSLVGTLDHVVRKYAADSTAKTFQPVIEIQMNHSETAQLLLHLPRSRSELQARSPELERYIVSRMNERLKPEMPFTSVQEMRDLKIITWGDPLQPMTVETCTTPQYAYGSNVILIGDAAMSCSPSSGIGADIGLTVDSKSVDILAASLRGINADSQGELRSSLTMKALDEFNMRKAESAVLWSQGSRMFYLTQDQANGILTRLEKEAAQATPEMPVACRVMNCP